MKISNKHFFTDVAEITVGFVLSFRVPIIYFWPTILKYTVNYNSFFMLFWPLQIAMNYRYSPLCADYVVFSKYFYVLPGSSEAKNSCQQNAFNWNNC